MYLYYLADDVEYRLKHNLGGAEGISRLNANFLGALRNYMRYTYAPLREMCTPEQKKRVEEGEARLVKLRDEVSETFRREIDNELFNAQFDPEERKRLDDLVQEYEQHERQFAGIENIWDVGT